MNYVLSLHAQNEIVRRGIPPHLLDAVLQNPEQILPEYGGKKAYQSRLDFGDGKMYLLRAIVNDTVAPAVIVTVYRTSKIAKYWSES